LACIPALLPVQAAAAGAPGDLAAGRERVERFLGGLQGLEARFSQTLMDRTGQIVDESGGRLSIRRPNRFRWDYREPHSQLIVADGTRIWLYDADLEQVTVRALDDTLSATPAMLLGGEGNLEDNFTVTQVSHETVPDSAQRGHSGALLQWVRMEPKRGDTDFKWVRLGFQGETLRFMELADKLGQTTRLEFSELERNPPQDPSRFTFTIPPGADVIGDAG
jgi:chaperone LolA